MNAIENLIKRVLNFAELRFRRSSVYGVPNPRRFHAYCVGTPRSGTESMAGLFAKNYRAKNEPGARSLIYSILDWSRDGRGGEDLPLRDYMQTRDRRLWLEFEANHLLYYVIDNLV